MADCDPERFDERLRDYGRAVQRFEEAMDEQVVVLVSAYEEADRQAAATAAS